MASIGGNHFLDNIDLLPDEVVVWEGGASKNGIAIQFIHLAGFILAIVIGLSLPLGLPKLFIMDNPDYVAPQKTETSIIKKDTKQLSSKNILSKTKVKRQPKTIINTQAIIMLLVFGVPLIVIVSIGLAWLRINNYWYVVTNERICIQLGILTRQTVAIDIDKIISVISSHSILDRMFKLHSVEIVHSGLSSLRANNGLSLFNPYKMHYVPVDLDLTSKLLHNWLPRDNRINDNS